MGQLDNRRGVQVDHHRSATRSRASFSATLTPSGWSRSVRSTRRYQCDRRTSHRTARPSPQRANRYARARRCIEEPRLCRVGHCRLAAAQLQQAQQARVFGPQLLQLLGNAFGQRDTSRRWSVNHASQRTAHRTADSPARTPTAAQKPVCRVLERYRKPQRTGLPAGPGPRAAGRSLMLAGLVPASGVAVSDAD